MTGSSAIAAHTVTGAHLMRPGLSMGPENGVAVPWRGRAGLPALGQAYAQGLLVWDPADDGLADAGAGGPPRGAGEPSYDVRGPPGAQSSAVRPIRRYPMSDHEYVQRVRRHPPSTLLPLIAATSRSLPQPREMRGHPQASTHGPWALADVACVSLTRGNQHRGNPATAADLDEIAGSTGSLSRLPGLCSEGGSCPASPQCRVSSACHDGMQP